MCIKRNAATGKTSYGKNSNGQFKYNEKIFTTCSFLTDYSILLEVYYFDAGKQYKASVFTKNKEVLEDKSELQTLVGAVIATCKKERRATR